MMIESIETMVIIYKSMGQAAKQYVPVRGMAMMLIIHVSHVRLNVILDMVRLILNDHTELKIITSSNQLQLLIHAWITAKQMNGLNSLLESEVNAIRTEMDVLAQQLMIVYYDRTVSIYNHMMIHPSAAGHTAQMGSTAIAIIMSAFPVLMSVTLDMVRAITHDTSEH